MSRKTILIAASPGIAAKSWMKEHLDLALQNPELDIIVVGKHRLLNSLLDARPAKYRVIAQDGKISRATIRKIIIESDFLLIFWNGIDHTRLLFEARLQSKKMKVIPFETTTVVNRGNDEEFDIYIGRGSLWGNPYPVGELEGQFTREEAIAHYRRDFLKKLSEDSGFHAGLLGLRGYRLGCYCKPLACHGDVLAEYLNELPPDNT